jgi:MFS family permease
MDNRTRHCIDWLSGAHCSSFLARRGRCGKDSELTTVPASAQSTADSSVFVADIPTVQDRYNASKELATLTISLYVVGLGCGPFVFAPLSELYGRQRGYVVSMIGACCIQRRFPISVEANFYAHRLHLYEPRMLLRRQVRPLFPPFRLLQIFFFFVRALIAAAIQPSRLYHITIVSHSALVRLLLRD